MKCQGIFIFVKILFEFTSLIFFAVSSVICFTGFLTLQKEAIFEWECKVLESAAIIYIILSILAFVSCWYTSHLLSSYFSEDDHIFLQLWNLLGLDKKKCPMPPPFDEKFENLKDEDPYSYLEPRKLINKVSQEEMKCNENLISKISPKFELEEIFLEVSKIMDDREPIVLETSKILDNIGHSVLHPGKIANKSCQEEMKYNETSISKLPPNFDLEEIVAESLKDYEIK